MKSVRRGRRTSGVEVTNVSTNGIWRLVDNREHFLAFKDFPWFKDASIKQISTVERPSAHHLHWPTLDIDLAVDSLDNPESYPLVSKVRTASKKRESLKKRGRVALARRASRRRS